MVPHGQARREMWRDRLPHDRGQLPLQCKCAVANVGVQSICKAHAFAFFCFTWCKVAEEKEYQVKMGKCICEISQKYIKMGILSVLRQVTKNGSIAQRKDVSLLAGSSVPSSRKLEAALKCGNLFM